MYVTLVHKWCVPVLFQWSLCVKWLSLTRLPFWLFTWRTTTSTWTGSRERLCPASLTFRESCWSRRLIMRSCKSPADCTFSNLICLLLSLKAHTHLNCLFNYLIQRRDSGYLSVFLKTLLALFSVYSGCVLIPVFMPLQYLRF